MYIDKIVTIKFYHQHLKKHDVLAIFLITSRKQVNNNCGVPCSNRINIVNTPSYVELPGLKAVKLFS